MISKFVVKFISFSFIFSIAVSEYDKHHYSPLEKKALTKFRGMIKFELPNEYMKRDDFLITWIKGNEMLNIEEQRQNRTSYYLKFSNGFDLKKALTNLENTLKWRKENKIDELLKDGNFGRKSSPIQEIRKDKDGSLVAFFRYGDWDFKKALETETIEDISKQMYYQLEHPAAMARSSSYNGPQYSWVLDVKGFDSEKHACPKCEVFFSLYFKNLNAHYPNLIKKFILVNAGKTFDDTNSNWIRANLSPKLNEHVDTFGDKKEWLSVVEDIIDSDQIPKDFIDGPSTTTTTIKPSRQSIGQPFVWNSCAACNVQSAL